jgi:hypothetical protein
MKNKNTDQKMCGTIVAMSMTEAGRATFPNLCNLSCEFGDKSAPEDIPLKDRAP